jgi:hypothetical protein
MGQYWKVVNLDKREFLHPHKLGCGLKLWEIMHNRGVMQAMVILQAAMPVPRGGGDIAKGKMVSRWTGDRVVLIGDYAEADDYPTKPGDPPANEIYHLCTERYDGQSDAEWDEVIKKAEPLGGLFVDISELVLPEIEEVLDARCLGDGWRTWVDNDLLKKHGYDPDDRSKLATLDKQTLYGWYRGES